ncbi:MAG: bifunctional glutamate N-acetyltransferase/amino-acid acetyltransferase ArgJ [Patescibacteria group bacterium]
MTTKFTTGGIAAPKGFTASGLFCGIKKSKKKDLALIYSEVPCTAAGVFTTNKVQASCVVINKKHLADGKAQAILANSGNANCMTGKSGFKDSETMAATIGTALHIAKQNVLVASTGVIGKPLPIGKIVDAAPELVKKLSKKGAKDAALGILTTDHTVKEVAAEVMIGKTKIKIGAIAKGAGMIHPQMALSSSAKGFGGTKHATMLCFVTTDASIALPALRTALDEATQNTFNMITIDGDMSTNDMVLVLANGMAGNKKIIGGSKESKIFSKALAALFLTLAKLMVRDAEGATKFVEVRVLGAKSDSDARVAARAVASSNLVKCALFGSDPNWGRIAAAIGQSAAHVDPWKMKIYLGKELVLQKGGKVEKKAALLDKVFAQKNIRITVDLGLGTASATAYTCDLSLAYVQLNSAYRT